VAVALDELYEAPLAGGGKLVIHAGGDIGRPGRAVRRRQQLPGPRRQQWAEGDRHRRLRSTPTDGPGQVGDPRRAPFMSKGRRATIFKQAKNPTTAKLYFNWRLTTASASS
jgi:hypothetical protein